MGQQFAEGRLNLNLLEQEEAAECKTFEAIMWNEKRRKPADGVRRAPKGDSFDYEELL